MNITVNLTDFDGPLDLLLYLIKKDEIDIYDIPIFSITEQYLSLLEQMKEEKLNVAGDFFVMAATLIRIKTQMLLPKPEYDELETIEDPREELVFRLIQYKAFKEMAFHVKSVFDDSEYLYYRGFNQELNSILEDQQIDLSINHFSKIFNELIPILTAKNDYSVINDHISIDDKIHFILSLIDDQNHLRFSQLNQEQNKLDIIVSFMAILELAKTQKIRLIQNNIFDEIWLEKV